MAMPVQHQSAMADADASNDIIRNLEAQHYEVAEEKIVNVYGQRRLKVIYKRNASVVERVGAAATGVLGSAVTLGTWNLSPDFRQDTWKVMADGTIERTVFFDVIPAQQEDTNHLSYQPTNARSIGEHIYNLVLAKDQRVKPIGRFYVMLEYDRPGVSSFIMIPISECDNRNFNNAESVQVWHTATGGPVLSETAMWRIANVYCRGYDEMQKAWDGVAEKIANKLFKKKDASDSRTLDQFREIVKKQGGSVKINVREHYWAFYGKEIDRNKVKVSSYHTGMIVKFPASFAKEVDRICNVATMEHKGNLTGDKLPSQPRPPESFDLDPIPEAPSTNMNDVD